MAALFLASNLHRSSPGHNACKAEGKARALSAQLLFYAANDLQKLKKESVAFYKE